MFKVEAPKEITWPVTVSTPRDGGNVVRATFTGKFKILSNAEFNAIYLKGGSDEDLARAVLVGWEGNLCDESGASMEFNEENLCKLVAIPFRRIAVVDAYLELSQGKKPAIKN